MGQPVGGPSSETRGVRKQYHFWPGTEGLDAWDVDRLIDMSASLAEEEVPVTAIWEVDTVCWFDESQHPTVRTVIEHVRLIEEVELSYPIILGPNGRVMDGMHRVAVRFSKGARRLLRFDCPTYPTPTFGTAAPTNFPPTSSAIRRSGQVAGLPRRAFGGG